jgi:hypothetical protein
MKFHRLLILNFLRSHSARDEFFQVSVPEDNSFLNKYIKKRCDGESCHDEKIPRYI